MSGDAGAVKRARLKTVRLSAYEGSNPSPRIFALVAQPGLEHQVPNLRVAGSNPVGGI